MTVIIILLAMVASGYGLLSGHGADEKGRAGWFTSIRGEKVELYGRGIYQYDSFSVATQAIAQDGVTLAAGVPLLLVALVMSLRGRVRGRLLLAGALGYFTYTYASYCFLATYNNLFLIYVMLFSASLFAFILTLRSLEREKLEGLFKAGLPSRSIGLFLLFITCMILMLWLGRIVDSLRQGTAPEGLEHYTTLVIQALDLAILLPLLAVTGILLIRRQPFGNLLASVVIVKVAALLTSITMMIVGMLKAGVHVSTVELIVFPAFNVGVFVCLYLLLRNVQESGGRE
ncbi:hypothetical protein [Paenibacillus tritici]|uniref:hypothetical protein n=1 Tax=Paenibacillus tritici TaxID=1873425 RepID=UPI001567A81B|nr:hypothetical protein [Paenibacillus tritici]